ncbi:MAG TPA: hypothetical protein VGO78_18525, partial [Acidimicrobiales bacterium]|nr:hypothetical protein [Acidimicrobiales bacterium]
SAHDPAGNIAAVREVLHEIGAGDVPELVVFNKLDLTDGPTVARLIERWPGSVAVSAVTGAGIEEMVARVGDRLRSLSTVLELVIPYERGDLLAAAHRSGEILEERPGEGGMYLRGRFDEATIGRLQDFVTDGATPTPDGPATTAPAPDGPNGTTAAGPGVASAGPNGTSLDGQAAGPNGTATDDADDPTAVGEQTRS